MTVLAPSHLSIFHGTLARYEKIGDECSFAILATERGGNWNGGGVFCDKDQPIVAILNITGGAVDVYPVPDGPGWWRLWGTIKIYEKLKVVKQGYFGIDIVDGKRYTLTGKDEFAIYIGDSDFGGGFEATANAATYLAWSGQGLECGNIRMAVPEDD